MIHLVIIHHSAVSGDKPQFDAINKNHKSKKYPLSSLGYWVGYQYVIEKTGERKRARTEYEVGAHTVAADPKLNLNRDGIGICLAGDFTKEKPTQFQLESLAELVEEIKTRHDIRRIVNHRDVKATACPGFDFAGWLNTVSPAPVLSPAAQVKRLQRGIARATGKAKEMLVRQLERLLTRMK